MSARLLKDPATASSRIFVGHLQTDDMNKTELEEHFAKYGKVVGSLINRGFGFVQFDNDEAARNAIQKEDGSMFKGRRIDVRPAKKDSHGGGPGQSGPPGMGNQGKGGGPGMGGGSGSGMGGGGPGMGGGSGSVMGGGGPGMGGGGPVMCGGPGIGSGGPSMGGGPGMGGGGGGDSHPKPMGGNNNLFGPVNNPFGPRNNSFGVGNQNFERGNQAFGGPNQMFNSDCMQGANQKLGGGPPSRGTGNDQFNDDSQEPDDDDKDQQLGDNEQFNNSGNNQNRGGNNQFGGNQNRGNDPIGGGGVGNDGSSNNQNRNNQFSPGNQNRPGPNNQNRNQNNQSGNSNQNQNPQTGLNTARPRGTRGGKNRNKNRDNQGNNNFRDRSPIGRGGRGNDDKGSRDWDLRQGRDRQFGRDSFGDGSSRFDDFKGSSGGFGSNNSGDGPSASTEKNDCEIIVVNKILTEYAEMIEMRLKKMGLTVDLLFPNEDVPLSRVLGNIASRGCLYAVVVTPINMEHHSLTLNILHGLPQEHRNMPVDDAIILMGRDFSNYKSGGRSVPLNTPFSNERHPDAIQVLVNMLADNHQLTVLQYDRLIKYLEMKREGQVQIELGDAKDLAAATALAVNDPKQVELQSRILNILNSNKPNVNAPIPSPVPAPTPVPPATWAIAPTNTSTVTPLATGTGVSPSPLLNDPTVQKALDSLLQGNLLKSIGDPQPTPAPTPLFAAFPNIARF